MSSKSTCSQAHFYSIVSRDTVEQDFALNRQLFLCEQGYEYRIVTLERPDAELRVEAEGEALKR